MSFWLEPRPPAPAGRSTIDLVLAAVLAPLALAEGALRSDLPGGAARPIALAAALLIVALLPWRRAHAFAVFCASFSCAVGVDLLAFALGTPWEGLWVNAVILLLPFSLFRWGAGREAAAGAVVLVFVYVSALLTDDTSSMQTAADRIGAGVVLLLPAVVGATVRFRDRAQRTEVERARARERERLARDLHDTVAHHVSAMVLQAQAGRLVLASKPEVAARALAVIEEEGARALRELRSLVGVLRAAGDGAEAPLLPQPGLADVAGLARVLADGRVIEVVVAEVVVSSSVGAAVFRIAQEGVTNAVRHARDATRVSVRVEAAEGGVRVCVDDDGARAARGAGGFGLAGMAERAALLGGSFSAGARDGGGWRVEAFLPQEGEAGEAGGDA